MSSQLQQLHPSPLIVRSTCRQCGSANLHRFLDLGSHPLANGFLRDDQLDIPESTFPLEAHVCGECYLAQLIHVVHKDVMFRDYIYFSSGMPRVSPHWREYAEDVIERFLGGRPRFVVEIGSNDGILLKQFRDAGHRVLGIDPARNIAAVAESHGIPTRAEFFSPELAEELARSDQAADAVLANNVVAHIDDQSGLFAGIQALLAPGGVFVMEAPYLVDMFENLTYDTIYHEHLSFLALEPIQRICRRYGLEAFDARIVQAQGQSIRLFVGHQGRHDVTPAVDALRRRERELGLDDLESYHRLAARVQASKERLLALLRQLRRSGKRIAAYGAPAKGNTLLNYCGIGTDLLEFALEDLPSKQGLFTPGMRVPVVSRQYAQQHLPDYYLLLAWNYKDAILDKERDFRQAGGKFIVPVGDEPAVI